MILLILSQWTSPFPVNPGKQTQLIVLLGSVLWTMHSAFGAQGWIAVQGFLHSWSRHASLLGQSLSSKHSGSYTGTGIDCEVYEILAQTIISV